MNRMKTTLIFGLVAFCALAASVFVYDSTLRARALAEADRDLAARASRIADSIDRTLQARITEVLAFAALPSLRGFAASDSNARAPRAPLALADLNAIVAADSNARAAVIVDPSGAAILTTDTSMLLKWGERAFVREALAGRLYASVPARDFDEVSQYYSAPVLDNAGNVAGALFVSVAVEELWDLLANEQDVLLVDEDGVRIADRSATPQYFAALAPLAPEIASRALAEKRYGAQVTQIPATNLAGLAGEIKHSSAMTLTFRDTAGQAMRATARRTVTNPWTVIVFRSEDALFSPARDALFLALGLGGVFFVAGATFWGIVSRLGQSN
jgi:C4-dicarboxylate-specific signal transduction histidine kinase